MATYHNLLSKCDRALVAFIVAKAAGAANDTFPAKRSQDRELPCTIAYSERAEEVAPYSGTYLVRAAIMVMTPAPVESAVDPSQPRLDSEERVAATFDLFHTNIDSAADKLGDDITAAARAMAAQDPSQADLADLTIQDVVLKGIEAGFEEGTGIWTDTLNLELVACPANVSDE